MGLESLQRCLAYCYLRESIPQHDRSGEETLMVAGERCWNLHKACVMASGSVVKWSQVPFSAQILGVRFYSILFCSIFFYFFFFFKKFLEFFFLHISIIQYQVKSGKLFRIYRKQ